MREIEKKYRIKDAVTFELVKSYLMTLFSDAHITDPSGIDVFWSLAGADFVRLRQNPPEFTIKNTDKGSIVDRMEANMLIGSFEEGLAWADIAFGRQVGSFHKQAAAFFCEGFNVSLYTVSCLDGLFLEVEAPLLETVDRVSDQLKALLTLEQETRSLYQLAFEKE